MTDKELAVIEAAVKTASLIENLIKQGFIKGTITQQSLYVLIDAVNEYKAQK